MWTGTLLAADSAPAEGLGQTLIVVAGTLLGTIFTGLIGLAIAYLNTRNRTLPAPPAPDGGQSGHDAVECIRRHDDNDERDDVQDRRHARAERDMERVFDRLDRLEDHHDRRTPGWRRE